MTELFIVGANGQLEVNFDSLVLVTSTDFVKEIKEELEDGNSKIVDVRVLKRSGNIVVRIFYKDLIMYEYNYSVLIGNMGRSSISLSQVELFLKLSGRGDLS
jgi:hypothetical protein